MAELAVVGAAISAVGTLAAGSAQKKASEYEAAQLRSNAKQAEAVGQRDMLADQQQTNRLISRARAVGAASGFGGAVDTSTLKQIGDIKQEGDYQALGSLYAGKEKARGMRNQAAASIYEGKVAQRSSYLKAAGTLVSGAAGASGMPSTGSTLSSWAAKYG